MEKEHFRKFIKHPCPDCGNNKLKLVDISDEDNGVSYCETYELCGECGYERNITNKRNKNNKIDIE